MSLPKHKYLVTYRLAEIIHDGTMAFCSLYLCIPIHKRTREQMEQAARSGKQNIVEGVGQSQTSKKGEIKLLGVAKASLEELITDFEDFLRQRNYEIWPKGGIRVSEFRKLGFKLSTGLTHPNLSSLTKL